ncbi:ARI3A protein, partial [Ptilonorhynchus violaceus]|nr:ARI3A protein [Ptilonorhynchus violaceus]
QLYELDEDPKRKEFLDDLFGFMQKRGTPVNRIPIMAKQVLDLYTLYQLVTDKGGLVEVINKKIWREITKGLNLPTSITRLAGRCIMLDLTLALSPCRYMKYLYPYECEKRALSSPGELQAAIDSNRREGRRQTFGTALFNYSPASTPALLGTPKMPLPALSISTHSCGQLGQVHTVKKEDGMLAASVPGRIAIPVGLAGHHLTAAQAAAASQAVVLEQLREKLETGEPPEKKVALTAEEQQRLVQHALQHNLLAVASQFPMNVKISSRDDRQETALNLSTNGISSINMSIEINGVVYTGVLFARRPSATPAPGGGSTQTRLNPMPAPNPLLPASSQSHTPTSTSP